MLANEGNPLDQRNRRIRERLEKVRAERDRVRAVQGAVWIVSSFVLALGVFLLFADPGAALIVLGLLGLTTAWTMGVSK